MKDLNHEFLISGWLVHNQFIELNNLFEVVMHKLLIEEMTSLDY